MDYEYMPSVERLAYRGAKLLDRYRGDWPRLIDLDHLDQTEGFYAPGDVSTDCGCVLAQVDYSVTGYGAGTYVGGKARLLAALGIDEEAHNRAYPRLWAFEHGFLAVRPDAEPHTLNRAWIKEIENRLPLIGC